LNTAAPKQLCSHCLLGVGPRGTRRVLDGEEHSFCCYGCCLAYQVSHGNHAEAQATWLLVRLGVGAFLAMNIKLFSLLIYSGTFEEADAELLPVIHVLLWLLATPLLVILGWPFLRDAWQEASRGQLTANILLLMGVGAAYIYSVASVVGGGEHVYFDTVALLLVLFTLGRYLEANARARAVRSLAPMLEAEQRSVTVVREEGETLEPLRTLPVGALVRILPGERIPVDGFVQEGSSCVDESIVTGEPRPVDKAPGSAVISGSINHTGPLLVRSTAAGNAGRWAGISRTVRDALARRSPGQRLADRIAGAFVPMVLVAAGATFVWWSAQGPFEQALLTALAVLVVACPCALGLAAPLATTLGIGRLAERGSLVRSPEVLERLARARVVAFDKTGTLTLGRLRLKDIIAGGGTTDDALIARAAALEKGSEHPLARAICAVAHARGLSLPKAGGVRAVAGRGMIGQVDETTVAVGNASLMRDLGWPPTPELTALEADGETLVYVGWRGTVRGALRLDDTLLDEAAATVAALQRAGLQCVLLTGDLPAAAERAARALRLDRWHAGLAPEDKAEAVAELTRRHGAVIMVGDGLNDGPVLASASVGIAVGTATDLARESADMTLPRADLRLLPAALLFARRVRRIVLGNLAWAFGYNLAALLLAALGYLTPILAAVLMTASSLVVVANSLRLERGLEAAPTRRERIPDGAPRPATVGRPAPVVDTGLREHP
jgi:heavy metal translocating P-type ATPase